VTEDWAALFDFGNTLADETWMTTDLGVFTDWPDVYRRVVGPLGTDWGLVVDHDTWTWASAFIRGLDL
jgi:hypothetical protein